MDALIGKHLRLLDHRLLWWLLAHQVRDHRGRATGTVREGWRAKAMHELRVDKAGLWRAQQRLRSQGVIDCRPRQRNLRILGAAFERKR